MYLHNYVGYDLEIIYTFILSTVYKVQGQRLFESIPE